MPKTKQTSAFDSKSLLAIAESKGDKEELIYAAELFLLRRVSTTSSDLIKAREWEEFRDACGGIEAIENDHRQAVVALEQWYRDGEG
jgi:hypothetical protein